MVFVYQLGPIRQFDTNDNDNDNDNDIINDNNQR